MGLDSIEIVVEIEEAFGINIPDEEVERIRTVADFHNCVWKTLGDKHSEWCKSQHIFYKLRKYICETSEVPQEKFYPDASMNDCLKMANRRKVYSEFESAMDLTLPKLVLSNPWIIFLNLFGFVTIGVGLMISIILTGFSIYSGLVFLIPTAGVILTFLLSMALNPLRTTIRTPKVADFIREIMIINYGKINRPSTNEILSNRKEVEFVINRIIADKSGLELSEITPERSITDDLGIN